MAKITKSQQTPAVSAVGVFAFQNRQYKLAVFSYIQDANDKTATSELNFERSAGEWECGLDVFFRSWQSFYMEFFNSAVDVLQTLVIALGGGLGVWGVVNLLEGYGNDNPGAKSQGVKQFMAGGGVALIGLILVPLLKGLLAQGG